MIFIDTQIWIYAQKEPDKKKFKTIQEYQHMLELHNQANKFMEMQLQNNSIAMTYHQIAELYHNLAFQGSALDLEYCEQYCRMLLLAKFMKWYELKKEHLIEAILLSKQSHIHIWDYLCILPLIKEIDTIYTCDTHLKHDSFTNLNCIIENPLGEWNIF